MSDAEYSGVLHDLTGEAASAVVGLEPDRTDEQGFTDYKWMIWHVYYEAYAGAVEHDEKSALNRLAYEAQTAQATVNSSIETRSSHPSYGATKTEIKKAYQRCYNLVEAHMLSSGAWKAFGPPLRPDILRYARFIGIDLESMEKSMSEMR
jgi:hypothetical protein